MPNQITAGGSPICVAQYDVVRRDEEGNEHRREVKFDENEKPTEVHDEVTKPAKKDNSASSGRCADDGCGNQYAIGTPTGPTNSPCQVDGCTAPLTEADPDAAPVAPGQCGPNAYGEDCALVPTRLTIVEASPTLTQPACATDGCPPPKELDPPDDGGGIPSTDPYARGLG